MDVFVKRVSPDHWKAKTYASNTSMIEAHIKPKLGKYRMRELTMHHILTFLDQLKDTPIYQNNNKYRKEGDRMLSSTTRMHIFNL